MICKNCGAEVNDDALFCSNCGAHFNDDNTQQHNNQPVEDRSVTDQPVAAQAETEQSVTEGQSVIEGQPAAEIKKKRRKFNILIAATSAVLVIAVAMIAFGKPLVTAFKMATMDANEYYADAEMENINKWLDSMKGDRLVAFNNIKAATDVSMVLTDSGKQMISALGIDLDQYMSADKISLSTDFSMGDGISGIDFALSLQDIDIFSMFIIEDLVGGQIAVQIPQVSPDYFSLLLETSDGDQVSYEQLFSLMTELSSHKDAFIDIMAKYAKPVMSNLFDFKKSTDVLEVSGIETNYTLLEAEVGTDDLAKTLRFVLEQAKNDEDIENLVRGFIQLFNDFASDPVFESFQGDADADGVIDDAETDDIIADMKSAIDEALASLDQAEDSEKLFTYKVWISSSGEICGREIETEDQFVFGVYNAVRSGQYASEIHIQTPEDGFELSGSAKRRGNVFTDGRYILSVTSNGETMDFVEIYLNELNMEQADQGIMSSEIILKASDDMQLLVPYGSFLDMLTLQLNFETNDSHNSISITPQYGNESIGTLIVSTSITEAEKLSVPDNAVGLDEYLNNVDSQVVIDNLRDSLGQAGVNQQILDSLEQIFASYFYYSSADGYGYGYDISD